MTEQETQRANLRGFLRQYRRAIGYKRTLEHRLRQIRVDMDFPLRGVKYDGMPHGGEPSIGAAEYTYREDEIAQRIEDQAEVAKTALLQVMDVIDYIPDETDARSVIEYRYIDGIRVGQIADRMHYSRSRIYGIENEALDSLLGYEKVQKILADYLKRLEDEQTKGGKIECIS
jgi:DNA-directed RNA polymerase specialized sigma24 family protein